MTDYTTPRTTKTAVGSTMSSSSSSRPPTQVYTRGTLGAVKLQKNSTHERRRSRSKTRTAVSPTRSSSQPAAPHHHHHALAAIGGDTITTSSATTFTTAAQSSSGNSYTGYYSHNTYATTTMRHPESVVSSDQGSVQSAPSQTGGWMRTVDAREPPFTTRKHRHREVSPTRSQDSDKLHIKMARKVIDGTSVEATACMHKEEAPSSYSPFFYSLSLSTHRTQSRPRLGTPHCFLDTCL